MNKLHIGSGTVYLPGWKNVDIFSNLNADTYASMFALPFDRESFDIIYASHVLEHVNRNMILSVLTHWRDLLKDKGILRIAVPNFKTIIEHYKKTDNLESILGLLYGGQKFLLDTHHVIFDYALLHSYLKKVGFKTIGTWNWKETDHSDFDDYSQAYLPHMDKKKGTLMSLNVEAIK